MKKALELAANSDVVVMALGELSGMDFEYASLHHSAFPESNKRCWTKSNRWESLVLCSSAHGRSIFPGHRNTSRQLWIVTSAARKPAMRSRTFSWAMRYPVASCRLHGPVTRPGSHLLRPHQLT